MEKLVLPEGCVIRGENLSLEHQGDIEIQSEHVPKSALSHQGNITVAIKSGGIEFQELIAAKGLVNVEGNAIEIQKIQANSATLHGASCKIFEMTVAGKLSLDVDEPHITSLRASQARLRADSMHIERIEVDGELRLEANLSMVREIKAKRVVIAGSVDCKRLIASEEVVVESGNVAIKRLEAPAFSADENATGIVMVAICNNVKAPGVRGFLHPNELDMLAAESDRQPTSPEPPAPGHEEERYPTQELEDMIAENQTPLHGDPSDSFETVAIDPSMMDEVIGNPAEELGEAPYATMALDAEPVSGTAVEPIELVEQIEPVDSAQAFDTVDTHVDEASAMEDLAEETLLDENADDEDVEDLADEDLGDTLIDDAELEAAEPIGEDDAEDDEVVDLDAEDLGDTLVEEPEPVGEVLPELNTEDLSDPLPEPEEEVLDDLENDDLSDTDPTAEEDDTDPLAGDALDSYDLDEAPSFDDPHGMESATLGNHSMTMSELPPIGLSGETNFDLVESPGDLDSTYEQIDAALQQPFDAITDPPSNPVEFSAEDLGDHLDDLPDHMEEEEEDEEELSADDLGDLSETFDEPLEDVEASPTPSDFIDIPTDLEDTNSQDDEDDLLEPSLEYEVEDLPDEEPVEELEVEEPADPTELLVEDLNRILDQIRSFFPEDNHPLFINQIQRYLDEQRFTLFFKESNRNAVLSSFDKFKHKEISDIARMFFQRLDRFKAEET